MLTLTCVAVSHKYTKIRVCLQGLCLYWGGLRGWPRFIDKLYLVYMKASYLASCNDYYQRKWHKVTNVENSSQYIRICWVTQGKVFIYGEMVIPALRENPVVFIVPSAKFSPGRVARLSYIITPVGKKRTCCYTNHRHVHVSSKLSNLLPYKQALSNNGSLWQLNWMLQC